MKFLSKNCNTKTIESADKYAINYEVVLENNSQYLVSIFSDIAVLISTIVNKIVLWMPKG